MTSSSKAVSSSSVILSGSEGSSDRKSSSSSSKIVNLSSSAYKPYDHSEDLAHNWNYEKSDYKTFVDPRNGRSYYYYTATSDFIVVAGFNDDRMGESIAEGMRSQSFSGYNTSGFSLIGCGLRDPDNGYFRGKDVSYWAYPEEHDYDKSTVAHDGSISSLVDNPPTKESGVIKLFGVSVRCTKLE